MNNEKLKKGSIKRKIKKFKLQNENKNFLISITGLLKFEIAFYPLRIKAKITGNASGFHMFS